MTQILEIRRNTVIKTSPEQSYRLAESDLFEVYTGMMIEVEEVDLVCDHISFYVPENTILTNGKVLLPDFEYYAYTGHARVLVDDVQLFNRDRLIDVDNIGARVAWYMHQNDMLVYKRPGEINLFGVEGMNLDGTLNDDAPDIYNDLIGAFEFDNNGSVITRCLAVATTEPGRYYTVTDPHPQGAARLALGQHRDGWQVGLHRSRYEALVQSGREPVTVYRDKDKNYSRPGDLPYTGWFGINIHKGTKNAENRIGKYSAGCQVIQDPDDFTKFMKVVKGSRQYRNDRQCFFTYTLLMGYWL